MISRTWQLCLCLGAISLGGCDIQVLNPQGEDPAVQENDGLFPPQGPQGSDSSPSFGQGPAGTPGNVPSGPAPTSTLPGPMDIVAPGAGPGLPSSPEPSVPLEPTPGPAATAAPLPQPETPEPDNAGGPASEDVDGGPIDAGVQLAPYSVTDGDAGVDAAE